MTSKQESKETLRKLVKKRSVFDLDALFDALGTRSRMTVFRRLQQVGYLSSFTHGGRFYTLENIPQFDEFGLWFHRDIGFSQAGTLKETVVLQVEMLPPVKPGSTFTGKEIHLVGDLDGIMGSTSGSIIRERECGRDR